MVVWENTLPEKVPSAKPTSACVYLQPNRIELNQPKQTNLVPPTKMRAFNVSCILWSSVRSKQERVLSQPWIFIIDSKSVWFLGILYSFRHIVALKAFSSATFPLVDRSMVKWFVENLITFWSSQIITILKSWPNWIVSSTMARKGSEPRHKFWYETWTHFSWTNNSKILFSCKML